MKTIIERFKIFFLSIWKELKDLKTLVLFFAVVLVIYSPVWGGYLIYAIFHYPWSLTMATVCLAPSFLSALLLRLQSKEL